MRPLAEAMTRKDPAKRPGAVAALQQWRQIRRGIFLLHRGWRLHGAEEGLLETVVFDVVGFMKLGILLSRQFLAWTFHLLTFYRRLF